jgi:hypothetical protein
MAVDCNAFGGKKLQMFGFGIPGQGFYSFNIPETKAKEAAATGIITILEGDASEEKLDRELKHLVQGDWDFKVRKMDLQEYLVIFPDNKSLETFSRLTCLEMSLFGLKSKIEKSSINPAVSSILQTVWIKIHNVPGFARDVETVKEITNLVAEPLVVDELSLIRDEPVRVKGRCRNPSAVKGYIEYFFNGEGINLKFEVEDSQGGTKGGKGGPPRPPGPSKPSDFHDKDPDNHHKGDKGRKSSSKFDRMGKIDKEGDTYQDDSMEELVEPEFLGVTNTQSTEDRGVPLAAFHPDIGLLQIDNNQPRIKEGAESYPVTLEKQGDKFGSGFVLEDQRKDTVVVPVPSDSQFIVHGADGPFLMEKSNWPNLKITEVQHEESPMESLTQENVFSPECGLNNESFVEHKSPQAIRKGGGEMEGEDLMDVISCQSKDSDLEENSQGWQPSKSKKPKKHMKNRVVVASRTSSRISRDGIPIAEKASRRAMERNNISGITSKNPFTVLNNTANAALASVISDLDIDIGNVDEQLDVFKLEELARVAIAEARYKTFLESQKAKDVPQGGDFEDLTMEVISNQNRECSDFLSKGGELLGNPADDQDVITSTKQNEDSILEC